MKSAKGSERLIWLSIMRGLTIVLVVMFHVQLVDLSTGQNHELCQKLPLYFQPFRMPFFIFSSGGLLYLSRIHKGWRTWDLYKDKIQRILVPFLFFVTFYNGFKAVFNSFSKNPIDISFQQFIESFYIFYGHPSAHLWFLAVLLFLMALYPLFKKICQRHLTMLLFLAISIGLFYSDLGSYIPDIFYLNHIHEYLVFFFFGIFFFHYRLYCYLTNRKAMLASIVIYLLLYNVEKSLFTSLSGIIMLVAIGIQLAKYIPGLFSSFRDYIYQIYLMSMVCQTFVELILWKRIFYNEQLFLVFYLLNILAGIYIPTLIAIIVKKCPYRWVRLCFGLK